jgi:hypothetical protein
MKQRRARQLGLRYGEGEAALPEEVERKSLALLQQLLRVVVQAERSEEGGDDGERREDHPAAS